MPTLIFLPRHTDDTQALWRAAGRRGWKTERLATWSIPSHLKDAETPILYCNALFGSSLAEQLGISLVNPPEDWLARLPEEYRRRQIRLTTLSDARRLQTPAFIKPPNDKSFPAGVYRGDELPREFDDSMNVLVSDIVRWEMEFRCFVLDRALKTYSLYSRFGEPRRERDFASTSDEDAEVERFMRTILSDPRVETPRAAVIDVGTIADAGWACVEMNAAWGAGIYGCDPDEVLDVLEHTVHGA